jgi:pre-mRNA-processing factor 19
MLCSISGVVPDEAVVNVKSGFVYEKRLIVKHIESTGTCPHTGEASSLTDLLPLKSSTVTRPRPLAASNVQGLLGALQGEWDALMLETHTLRKALETARLELSQSLYQHDASCRVVARLIRERDSARQSLAAAQVALAQRGGGGGGASSAGGAAMAEEGEGGGSGSGSGEGEVGITQAIVTAITDKHKELSKLVRTLYKIFPGFFFFCALSLSTRIVSGGTYHHHPLTFIYPPTFYMHAPSPPPPAAPQACHPQ